MTIEKYKELSYLLGCHSVVSDKEINALEVEVLNSYLSPKKDSWLYEEQKKIFSDDKKQWRVADILKELKLLNLNYEQKIEIIELLVRVGFGDYHFATAEKKLVEKVSTAIGIKKDDVDALVSKWSVRSLDKIQSSKLKWHESIWGRVESFLYEQSPKKDTDKRVDKLLGGLGFSRIIETLTDEAIHDYDRVSSIMNNINEDLYKTKSELNHLTESLQISKHTEGIIDILKGISLDLSNIMEGALLENLEMLDKKKRNIRYFTIAFMGRTKVGKSTFHKVITNQEDDDIGDGKVRTTRYNRSWYWEKLRIVDTPGIGAPGGETDTAIAQSIIDEADMIVYIVTNDSIQETEFNFFEKIKDRNKPLYIILNYKSKLTEPVYLNKFLRNPISWMEMSGPKSIQGHFDRIYEKLNGKYNMDAVKIIPVHLLAAQMSMNDNLDKESVVALLKGSNIDNFIRLIKKEIYETGCLKKSLSIIDGCSYRINDVQGHLTTDADNLKDAIGEMSKKRQQFSKFITEEGVRIIEDIKTIYDMCKKELQNRAVSFADVEYENKKAGEKWNKDREVNNCLSRANDKISNRIDDYSEKIKDRLEEMASDIKLTYPTSRISSASGENIRNDKLVFRLFGSAITLVIPLLLPGPGWFVAMATVLFGSVWTALSRLFKSSEEKKREAISRLRSQLDTWIDQTISEQKQNTISSIQKSLNDTKNTIDSMFDVLITGSQHILSIIINTRNHCLDKEATMNSLESFRILDYLGKSVVKEKKIGMYTDEEIRTRFPVIRDWQKQTLVYQYNTGCKDEDRVLAQKATQMNIKFM